MPVGEGEGSCIGQLQPYNPNLSKHCALRLCFNKKKDIPFHVLAQRSGWNRVSASLQDQKTLFCFKKRSNVQLMVGGRHLCNMPSCHVPVVPLLRLLEEDTS